MVQHFPNIRKLLAELIWGLVSTALVIGVHLRPKSGLARIKSYQDMSRFNPLHHVIQHEVKTIDGIGMQTYRIFKPINLIIEGKKGPKSDR